MPHTYIYRYKGNTYRVQITLLSIGFLLLTILPLFVLEYYISNLSKIEINNLLPSLLLMDVIFRTLVQDSFLVALESLTNTEDLIFLW